MDSPTGIDRAPERYTRNSDGRETIDRMRDYCFYLAENNFISTLPIPPTLAEDREFDSHNAEVGKLTVFEIFGYFGEPQMFGARSGQKIYFVVLITNNLSEKCWLCVPMSLTRYRQVRLGKIDLDSACLDVEGEKILLVTYDREEETSDSRWIDPKTVNPNKLPPKGERLDAPEDMRGIEELADLLFVTHCKLTAMKYRDRLGLKEGVTEERDSKAAWFYEQMAVHVESKGTVPDPRSQRPDFTPYVRREWRE